MTLTAAKTFVKHISRPNYQKKILPYLLVSPYLVFCLLFVLFPVLFSFYLTFHQWNIISPMKFVAGANYIRLFHDRLFWKAILNTAKFLLLHIPLQILVALTLAYLLHRKMNGVAFFKASFFMPVVVSGVVITIMWQQLLGYDAGVINRILHPLGMKKIGWLIDPDMAIYSIALIATWKNLGLYVVLFLIGLQTVPPQYYEAAKLDGATKWQLFYHITLPMINPTIFMVVLFSTLGGFALFIEPYVMTGGGPLNTTLSAVLYIYKQAFEYYNMGYSSTLGFSYALIVMIVVIIQKRLVEREMQ